MGAELVVLDLPGCAGGVPLLARAARSIMPPTRDGSRSRELGSGQGLVPGHGFEAPRPRAEAMVTVTRAAAGPLRTSLWPQSPSNSLPIPIPTEARHRIDHEVPLEPWTRLFPYRPGSPRNHPTLKIKLGQELHFGEAGGGAVEQVTVLVA